MKTKIQSFKPNYRHLSLVESVLRQAIRNAYRNLLRILEQREDRLLDSYLMQRPELKRFGR